MVEKNHSYIDENYEKNAILNIKNIEKQVKIENCPKISHSNTHSKDTCHIVIGSKKEHILTKYIKDIYNIDKTEGKQIIKSSIEASKKYNIDPLLILSIIEVESSFNKEAKSKAGATGLMQIMPKIHRTLINDKKANINSIKGNIEIGSAILSDYIDKSDGNIKNALLKYHGSFGKNTKYSNLIFNKFKDLSKIIIAYNN